MFRNIFQSGILSILYSMGTKPLQLWDKKVRNGHIKRISDDEIQSLVLEILGTDVSTIYITLPANPALPLGIKLPFLVLIIKNLKQHFTFEIQVLFSRNLFLRVLCDDHVTAVFASHLGTRRSERKTKISC